jgi:hypothetical protein
MNLPHSWGIATEEKKIKFPCDDINIEHDPSCTLFRGITIKAKPETILNGFARCA